MLYGWGVPAVAVGICLIVEFATPWIKFGYLYDSNSSQCWIHNSLANIIAFGVPLAVILLVNGAFFAASIVALSRTKARAKRRLSSVDVRAAPSATPSTPTR